MALPYQFWRSLQDSRALPFNKELEVSLNIADGMPLKWSANGKLTPISATTDRPFFILNGAAVTSSVGTQVNLSSNPPVPNQIGNGYNATSGPGGNQSVLELGGFADVIPAMNGMGIWRTTFTPVINNFVANASGSPTSIILPNSPNTYSSGAFVGGTVYCKSLNQQARITASSSVTAGSAITLTIVSPLGQPGATINADGLTFSATPLGPGMQNIQFSHVTSLSADGYVPSQLGVGSADWSSGYITIDDVDCQNGYVFVIFQ
jgi:hypothetical protein